MNPKIIDSPSPNHNARPAGVKPRVVVLHGTAGNDAGDLAWLRSPESKVSYHDLIMRDGTIHRLVDPARRAWHAGVSTWRGVSDVNDFSIGVALSNLGNGEAYTDAQYKAAGWRLAQYRRAYSISLAEMVGHYHVSPGRKTDPWYTFQWGRLFSAMLKAG